jgi:FOG: TPR repeat, SEL1 subfamily
MRPKTAAAQVTASGLTADDHVAKGIECHERGSLSESTYHLRVAAKQDHPTGMLLYALACRHGWGMRSNEKEGVRWLRKAVDSVGLEMLADPDGPGASKAKELQKAYRAQFALSIYELGVSYLNGWGIEQDKSLALRCFEIAGQWGDVDAMAEAGFCYAEGVGCKKDMKKAARFYRQAEAKGMSMVGNSWYVFLSSYILLDLTNDYPQDLQGQIQRGRVHVHVHVHVNWTLPWPKCQRGEGQEAAQQVPHSQYLPTQEVQCVGSIDYLSAFCFIHFPFCLNAFPLELWKNHPFCILSSCFGAF